MARGEARPLALLPPGALVVLEDAAGEVEEEPGCLLVMSASILSIPSQFGRGNSGTKCSEL